MFSLTFFRQYPFTKQLLDNGDDVEVAAVSDQAAQTLSSLTKMTWIRACSSHHFYAFSLTLSKKL